MDKVIITSMGEMDLHIVNEVKKRNLSAAQQKKVINLLRKIIHNAYQLGRNGSVEVELSDSHDET